MIALALFASTFVLVMALGIQSLNVNGGHRVLACATSFAIGAANLVVLKLMPGPTSGLEIAAFLSGGPVGIWCAMELHPRLVRALRRGTVPPDLSPWFRPTSLPAHLRPHHPAAPANRTSVTPALGQMEKEIAMSQGKGKKRRERQEGNRRKRDPEDFYRG